HGCQAADAAVVFALHQLPAVVGALSDVHHGPAMGIHLLERLIAGTHIALRDDGTAAQCHTDMVGMHEAWLHVLVVHHQQPLVGAAFERLLALDREEVHAVMVRAHLHALLFTGIGDIEGRHGTSDGRTPGQYDLIAVTRWHDNLIRLARRNGGKANQRTDLATIASIATAHIIIVAVRAAQAALQAQAHEPPSGGNGTALEQGTASQTRLQHAGERPVIRVTDLRLVTVTIVNDGYLIANFIRHPCFPLQAAG